VTRIPVVAAALLALAACAPKPETAEQAQARLRAESDSAKTAIEAANARFARYLAAGQAESAALIYAEDAVMYPSGTPAITGRAAILAQFQQWVGMGRWTVKPTTHQVEASGPVAVETGSNVTTFTPGPQAPRGMAVRYPDTTNYETTWRKVDGRWLITRDMAVTTRAPSPAKTP
jgi:ketosteroid isomerase-like protein